MLKKGLVYIMFALACFPAFAQKKDNVGSVEINVVDQYKASIKEPTKLAKQPGFADTTTQKLPVKYSIRPQLLRFDFQPKPIQPIKIRGVRLQKLPKNMVRLGAGNYASALAEVVISNSRSKTFNWDIAVRHFSSQNGVQDIAYEKSPFMENEVWLGGKWLLKDYRLRAGAGADFNSFSFYGIPEGTPQALFPADLQKNNYQRYFARVDFERVFRKKLQIFQDAGVQYHYFTNNWRTNEHLVSVNSGWNYPQKVKDHIIGAELNMDWQQTNRTSTSSLTNQLNVQFFPKAMGKLDWFSYVLGLNFNFYSRSNTVAGNGTNDFSLYFFPEIRAEAELARDVLSVFAGWTGDVTMNGMYSLTRQNPWFNPAGDVAETGANRIYGGVEGAVAKNISYKIEGIFSFVNGLPVFTRSGDSLTMPVDGVNLPAFQVNYLAPGQMFQGRGELSYQNATTEVNLYGEIFTYDFPVSEDGQLDQNPPHLPAVKIGFIASQKIRTKFDVSAGLAYVGGRKALATDGQYYQAEMKDLWDARLDIGYNINQNLSAGLHVANLASQQYDLWLGYPVQRIRVMLTLMYKF